MKEGRPNPEHPGGDVPARHGGALLRTLLTMLLGLSAYEGLKSLFLPHLTLWQSHAITISVGSVLATLAAARGLGEAERRERQARHDAQERERSERALRRSERRHTALLENALDCVIGMDHAGRIIEWNPAAERTFGYARAEALGADLTALIVPAHLRAAHDRGVAHFLATGVGPVLNKRIEVMAVRRGGEEFAAELTVIPTHEGGVPLFTASLRDISERRQVEAALRAQEEQFRLVFENATHGIYRTTPDGHILLANPALLAMLGYDTFEELAARNLEQEGTEAAYERREFQARLEADGEVRGLEAAWRRRDGSLIFVRENARLVRDAAGAPYLYEGSVEDVTLRVEAEEALRRSEARFQRNAANAPGMMYQFVLHPDGAVGFPFVSDGCRDIYGLAPSEITADPLSIIRIIHPDDRDGFQASVAESARTLQPWAWEGRFVLDTGQQKWIQGASRPERKPNGEVLWDGLLMDVSARKADQEALQRAHEQLEDRVRERTAELASANAALEQEIQERRQAEQKIVDLNAELTRAYDATIEGWSRALDLRDKETEGHCRRVTDMTLRLAHSLGLPPEQLVHVRRGALLHDIGKMGVPDGILLKPGPLTDDEWAVMRRHPTLAYEMLSPIEFLRPALDIPHFHHEKWDGTGYPHRRVGEDIPLAARIFAVVDVWDALRSDRPYRAGWPPDRVCDHIHHLAGTHFDPQVVDAFLSLAFSVADTQPPLRQAA